MLEEEIKGVTGGIILIIIGIGVPRCYRWIGKRVEKWRSYECGCKTRREKMKNEIRYYRVAIMFIVFDVEVIYIYIYSKNVTRGIGKSYWIMTIWLWILILGWWYEIKKERSGRDDKGV